MQIMMSVKKMIVCLSLVLLTGCALHAADFYLIKDGGAAAYFECPEQKALRNTLNRFNEEIRRSAGVAIPINPRNKAKLNKIKLNIIADHALESEDQFSCSFPDKNTMVVKCTNVSVQWFLNHILEKYAGIHYLFNDSIGRSCNKTRNVKVPLKPFSVKPSFELGRYTYLSNPASRPWFYMKRGARTNHDLHHIIFPAKKYRKNNSYPDAIRPVINGKRLQKIPAGGMYWQPCYSNPETARIAVENILEYLKENPETQSISLTVNDCGGYCQCKECERVNGPGKQFDKSEVYFTWVKRVAEAVGKKYPELPIVALAYNLVYNPCSFKLPDNVVIALCFDLYSVTDPKMTAKRKNTIAQWGKKAKRLGIWDYSWGYPYFPPRMYLKRHAEMLRFLYKHGCRLYFGECEAFNSKEGPKIWLVHQLLWDINADENKLLDFWYNEVAGRKAAPYLRKFFDFWEDYFQSEEIRKTPWFRSSNATYMTGGDRSHIYALKKGDLAKARSYLEKALSLAETPEQKARIQKIERTYKYSECLLILYAAEAMPPEGILKTPQQALNLLKEIPAMVPYQEIKRKLSKELENDPWAQVYYKRSFRNLVAIDNDGTDALVSHLVAASKFAYDPAVAAEMKKLADNDSLPPCVNKVAQILLNQGKNKNLFTNGDFESELTWNVQIHEAHRKKGSGVRSTKYKYNGKYSYQIKPDDYTFVRIREKAEPDTYYLISLKVYQPRVLPDSYMTFAVYPNVNGRAQSYSNPPQQKFTPGEWHTVMTYCRTYKTSNGVGGGFILRMYPLGEYVYIDDVQLYKIGK